MRILFLITAFMHLQAHAADKKESYTIGYQSMQPPYAVAAMHGPESQTGSSIQALQNHLGKPCSTQRCLSCCGMTLWNDRCLCCSDAMTSRNHLLDWTASYLYMSTKNPTSDDTIDTPFTNAIPTLELRRAATQAYLHAHKADFACTYCPQLTAACSTIGRTLTAATCSLVMPCLLPGSVESTIRTIWTTNQNHCLYSICAEGVADCLCTSAELCCWDLQEMDIQSAPATVDYTNAFAHVPYRSQQQACSYIMCNLIMTACWQTKYQLTPDAALWCDIPKVTTRFYATACSTAAGLAACLCLRS